MDALVYLLETTKTDKFSKIVAPDLSMRPELDKIHIHSHPLNTYKQLSDEPEKGDDKT